MTLEDYNCPLCLDMTEETLFHLFIHCPFASQCWALIGIQINNSLDPFQMLQSFKDQLQVPFFMEIITLMCWTIWKARNDLVFRQTEPSLQSSKSFFFRSELELLSLRGKRCYSPSSNQWIANLAQPGSFFPSCSFSSLLSFFLDFSFSSSSSLPSCFFCFNLYSCSASGPVYPKKNLRATTIMQ